MSLGEEPALLSGVLPSFLVDHMVVSLAAHWLILPANDDEQGDDEEQQQRGGDHQADDHLWKKGWLDLLKNKQTPLALMYQ